jgi:hypothetical protein
MVEPVHPFQGGKHDRVDSAPGTAPADHPGFVEAADGFGEGIIVTAADAADRRLDAGVGQPPDGADRDILHAADAVVHQSALRVGAPVRERLLQVIQDKAGPGRTRHPPADNPPGEDR